MKNLNIIIFRTDRVGDLIVTCPAIITIKNYFEDPSITIVTSEKNYEYAKNLNIFKEVLIFPKSNFLNKAKFIYKLSKKKFDYTFIFDGKDRSIITSSFIKSNYKVALVPEKKIKFFKKFSNIKFFADNDNTNLFEIFNNLLNHCKINTKILHHDFLKKKKDNYFSKNIPINNFIHIHLDEKWITKFYIGNYTDIDPDFISFINFIEDISKNNDLLITTGLKDFKLCNDLINKYFLKKSDKIFYKKNNNFSIYFIYKPSFLDLESLLKNAKLFISCHGALTHSANSLNIKIIDIIEENKLKFYNRFTAHFKNYNYIFRSKFEFLKNIIISKIN